MVSVSMEIVNGPALTHREKKSIIDTEFLWKFLIGKGALHLEPTESRPYHTGDPVPEGMEVVTLASPLPWYAAAAVWVVWGLFLPMLSWISLVLAALCSLAAGLLTAHFGPKRRELRRRAAPPANTGTPEADEALDQGRAALGELRQLDEQIADGALSARIRRLEQVGDAIFDQVEAHPEKAKQIRRFMNYYLPTTLSLLRRYAELDAGGVEGETIRGAKQGVEQVMEKVTAGFEKQYDNLFTDEALDLSADIEVLEAMLGQEDLSRHGLR